MSLIADAFEALLRDHCTPTAVRQIEAGASPQTLWQVIAEAGFTDLLVPEHAGGAGEPLAELYPLLLACGRHALPLPLGQTVAARALLWPWLSARLSTSEGSPVSIGLAPHLERLGGGALRCQLVPFGLVSRLVLAADAQGWLLLDTARARRTATGVPGSLIASFQWDAGDTGDTGEGVTAMGPENLQPALDHWGAALHAGLLAGAIGRVFDMTLEHCKVREQFGRPLGQFQAVQHQMAVMAEMVAAASIAAEAAWAAQAAPAPKYESQPAGGASLAPAAWTAALAKARTSEAAAEVAALAHALHGAIGITAAYDLQLHTRRLHEWRMAHGSEDHWHRVLGQLVLERTEPLHQLIQEA
jgi:acyl-CoA dehydrogenase